MPTYKNDHNGDVVDVEDVEAERLAELDNWHEVDAPVVEPPAEPVVEAAKAEKA